MKTISFLSIAVLTLASCTASPRATTPVPIARGAEVCKSKSALCEELCASCTDKAGCFENAGECPLAGLHFNDTGDVGPDFWTPGCHYEYDDDVCTAPGRFFLGDRCNQDNRKEIFEWTVSACHPPNGDRATYDCNKECLKVGRGNGRCTPVPTACSGGGSAHCTCDQPAPTP